MHNKFLYIFILLDSFEFIKDSNNFVKLIPKSTFLSIESPLSIPKKVVIDILRNCSRYFSLIICISFDIAFEFSKSVSLSISS